MSAGTLHRVCLFRSGHNDSFVHQESTSMTAFSLYIKEAAVRTSNGSVKTFCHLVRNKLSDLVLLFLLSFILFFVMGFNSRVAKMYDLSHSDRSRSRYDSGISGRSRMKHRLEVQNSSRDAPTSTTSQLEDVLVPCRDSGYR